MDTSTNNSNNQNNQVTPTAPQEDDNEGRQNAIRQILSYQDDAFSTEMIVKTQGNRNNRISHLWMDTRRRRERDIAEEREDSEDKEETVKTRRITVDLVDV